MSPIDNTRSISKVVAIGVCEIRVACDVLFLIDNQKIKNINRSLLISGKGGRLTTKIAPIQYPFQFRHAFSLNAFQ